MTSRLHVVGGRPLRGTCAVQGSKNIALHLYAASMLMTGDVNITNAPRISDTEVCVELMTRLGLPVTFDGNCFRVLAGADITAVIDSELGNQIRPTATFGAAVLASCGRVTFPLPGGDAFSVRPIDVHLTAMAKAGGEIERRGDTLEVTLPRRRPRSFTMSLVTPYGPSLGATVSAVLLAVRADGTSYLRDASLEPEVIHTIEFLNHAGADIGVSPDGDIEVRGTPRLGRADYVVPVDREEAGTLVIAAGITGGQVLLSGVTRDDLTRGFLERMSAIGVRVEQHTDGTLVTAGDMLLAADVATGVFPAFPTDLQPQTTALLTRAVGRSRIIETIYPKRHSHIEGLRSFGADVVDRGDLVEVTGPTELAAAEVHGTDIRCATALLLAALAADGESRISGIYHLNRGYGALLAKLVELGACISDPIHESEVVVS